MLKSIILGIGILLVSSTIQAQQVIYVWRDSNGVTIYSDVPPTSDVPNVKILKLTAGATIHPVQPSSKVTIQSGVAAVGSSGTTPSGAAAVGGGATSSGGSGGTAAASGGGGASGGGAGGTAAAGGGAGTSGGGAGGTAVAAGGGASTSGTATAASSAGTVMPGTTTTAGSGTSTSSGTTTATGGTSTASTTTAAATSTTTAAATSTTTAAAPVTTTTAAPGTTTAPAPVTTTAAAPVTTTTTAPVTTTTTVPATTTTTPPVTTTTTAPSTTTTVATGTTTTAAPSTSTTATGGPITLSAVVSRTSGVAPLAVFFDASGTTSTATTQPFHELGYRWDFGDPGSGTWNTGSRPGVSSRNSATGPVAAHVFETPGTYTVTLTASGGINTASNQVQITVQDPNVVFSNANTICFSTSGNFSGAPAGFCTAPGATAITTSNFVTVMIYAATGKRLLLRRGETWTAATSSKLVNTGPGILGAFGSGALPIVQATANVTILNVSSGSTPSISDWRIMDIEFDGSLISVKTTTIVGINADGGFNNLTMLRLSIHDVHDGMMFSDSILDYYNSHGQPGHSMWSGMVIQDSSIERVSGLSTGGGGYCTFVSGYNFAYLGNYANDSTNGEHVLRTPQLANAVVSNNSLSNPAASKHVFKMHAPFWTAGNPPPGVHTIAYTQKVVVSDNKLSGGNSQITAWWGPEDDFHDERLRDIITERNWWVAGPGGSMQEALVVSAVNQTVRNNIFDGSRGAGPTAMVIKERGIEPIPDHVWVYNNTMYSSTPSGEADIIILGSGTTNMVIKNNLAYCPMASSGVLLYDYGSVSPVISNNSTNTQIKNTSPHFASGSPSSPADFMVTSGSYAIDTGLAIPVFSDFFVRSRPNGTAIDLGATEF